MPRPLLRWGSQGPDVKLLQQALNVAGSILPRLVVDGIFGWKTHARVQEFQRDGKLAVDGVAGPNTHGSLEEFYQTSGRGSGRTARRTARVTETTTTSRPGAASSRLPFSRSAA